MNTQKGFTLIELLIVIAIIAVLAGVVLLNIIGFIGKGKDTTAKGNMNTLLINVTSYYGTKKDFAGMIGSGTPADPGDPSYIKVKIKLGDSGYTVADGVSADKLSWCGCIDLKENSGTYYCVDATGTKAEGVAACSAKCTGSGADAGVCVP